MLVAGGQCYRASSRLRPARIILPQCDSARAQALAFGASSSAKSKGGQGLMSTDNIAPAVSREARAAPPPRPARPLVTAKDIYEVPRLAVQGMLAWTLPEAAWRPLSRLFGQVNAATHPGRNRKETADVRSVLPEAPYASRL